MLGLGGIAEVRGSIVHLKGCFHPKANVDVWLSSSLDRKGMVVSKVYQHFVLS